MADLFKEVIPSILQTKQPVITAENESEYVPFVVNKALSFHRDCILYANEMNKLPNADKLLQYHYLLNTTRGYKRPFQKWLKRETIENLDLIKEYYGYSTEKAKAALLVLSDDQIEEIRRRTSKGGLNNDKHRKSSGGETT